MRYAGLLCVALLLFASLHDAAAQVPIGGINGTLVQVVPQQGIVIKTNNGEEIRIPANAPNPIEVWAPADFAALPDDTPCIIEFGQIRTGAMQVETPTILLPTPSMKTDGSYIIRRTDGGLDFRSVPGLLKKKPTLGFQIGQARYQVRSQGGLLVDAPPDQQNVLFNRVIPLIASDQQRGIVAEFDFGSNVLMAGKDAKVFSAGGLSGGARIRIQRVEPVPTTKKK